MKIILIIPCLFAFFSPAMAKSVDATGQQLLVHSINAGVIDGFEKTGKWPPIEKTTNIENYALETKKSNEIILFNTLVQVPETPLLEANEINPKYLGYHLYAINRIMNFEKSRGPEGGRYAILYRVNNGEIIKQQTPWILESDVQVILKNCGGFDPKSAPFIFKDTYLKLGGDAEKINQISTYTEIENKHTDSPFSWLAVGISFFALVFLYFLFRIIHKKNANTG